MTRLLMPPAPALSAANVSRPFGLALVAAAVSRLFRNAAGNC
jgi:hypothetical protein